MHYDDKLLRCRDCGMDFVFTAGEQEFYARKGLLHEPTRCTACRALRKGRTTPDAGARVANGSGNDHGTTVGERRQFFYTICTECGGEARDPFQTRTDRPVYCSDCFERVTAVGRAGGDR
ncbi:MAG: zinc-ribbon domain containing protein, partial [Chloroflexi bacterium]|nr:zinc-ribbon domain containing protein [Chloroflexota bacterium]